MIKLYEQGIFLANGKEIFENAQLLEKSTGICTTKEEAEKNTISYGILEKHNTSGSMENLKLKFDALASHDITYVSIVQTCRAGGLEKFPIPYVLTNCHNSLCAVGGTINEDDHMFGLSAAKRYGGIYVPAHQAVIHQYMREMMSGGGKMILGSDSHTRYGALGTMAIGEGGGELVKQLLNRTYDVERPSVIAVYLTGTPQKFVGPQDIALAIIGKVFKNGFVKNKIMEFVGDGIKNLNVEYRNGIDVMTTETTCLSSVWVTDSLVKEYYADHGRENDYAALAPKQVAYYDGAIYVDMSQIKPMIAMPFHPSNVYTIDELNANLCDITNEIEKESGLVLKDKIRNGKLYTDQGVIAGCAGGTFDNLCVASDILQGASIGSGEFALSVYPSSQPTYLSVIKNGVAEKLMTAGATMRSAFCGPCFGAGDVPANNAFSIRHTTRNFPNREGSKPSNNQIASVALMDARSIAATAVNNGVLTSAEYIDAKFNDHKYYFSKEVYDNRVYNGFGKADQNEALKFGPNITDWPKMSPLADNMLLMAASVIDDPVTTTDELIPSGETSSYRSNPLGLAEFTLSRKDPSYVPRAKEINKAEAVRLSGSDPTQENEKLKTAFEGVKKSFSEINIAKTAIGSFIYAQKPGDGSAREQAASCQKVLGGYANVAKEYATKRYRSNLINWGMLPFIYSEDIPFEVEDFLFIPNVRKAVEEKQQDVKAYIVRNGNLKELTLKLSDMTDDERKIILAGCLINYYKS